MFNKKLFGFSNVLYSLVIFNAVRIAFATRIAFVLLCLFVFTLPFVQVTEIPAMATISMATGFAALFAGALAVAARKQVRTLSAVHLAMGAFILWSAVTLTWSIAPAMTVERVMIYVQLFVPVILVWELCTGEEDVLRVLGAFVLGTLLPALSTLAAFLPGRQTLYLRAAAGSDANSQEPAALSARPPIVLRQGVDVESVHLATSPGSDRARCSTRVLSRMIASRPADNRRWIRRMRDPDEAARGRAAEGCREMRRTLPSG